MKPNTLGVVIQSYYTSHWLEYIPLDNIGYPPKTKMIINSRYWQGLSLPYILLSIGI